MGKNNTQLTRREALRLGGVAGAGAMTALAGCTGGGGDSSSEITQSGSGSGGGNGSGGGGNSSGGSSADLVAQNRIGSTDAATAMDYWLLQDQSHRNQENPPYGDAILNSVYQPWAEDHPDARFDLQYQTNLEQMKVKLLQTVAKGNAPALSQTDSFWVPNFYGDLQPVTPAIENPDDWYPFVKDIAMNDGEWVALWKYTDCRALYYRVDMMDKYNDGNAPETWDELVSVGQKITQNEDMDAFMYNGGRWEATTFDNLAYFWAQGGQLIDDQGAPVFGKDENYDALLSTFEWFKRTRDSGITPQRVANIDDYALLREAALNGETAMFLGGNWQITTIKEQVDSESEWRNWQVGKIPQRSADTAATGTGGWTEGIFTTDEAKRQAALDFVSRYGQKDVMAETCEVGGFLPTRQSVFEESDYFAEDPYFQTYADLLQDGKARPGYPIYITLSEEWQVAAGKVLTGQASPKQAVDTMVANVRSEYDG